MADQGGLGFSRTVVLAPGFSSDDRLAQIGEIPATKSSGDWGEDKSVLIASWLLFMGMEVGAIVTIETLVRKGCLSDERLLRISSHPTNSIRQPIEVLE